MPDVVYDAGDVVRLEVAFQAAGVFADPATIVLTITDPAGTVTTKNYPTPADITKDSVGHYHYDHALAGSAVVGTYEVKWVTTGTPATTEFGFFSVRSDARRELVRTVRRMMGDRPSRFYITDNPLAAGTLVITATVVGDAARVPHAGVWLEFDDGTDEIAISTGPGDPSAGTVAVARGQDGTSGRSHVQNTAVLVEPRLRRGQILDVGRQVTELECWPHVWVAGEVGVAYQAANSYYASPVADIEEVVFAYQVVAGDIWGLHASYLPPTLADEANFPNGVLVMPHALDTSTIRVMYRARPTLGNLTEELRSLVEFGVLARLQLLEESAASAPDAGLLHGSIQPGSRARAGIIEWQSFIDARNRLSQRLMAAEDHRRRRVSRGVA